MKPILPALVVLASLLAVPASAQDSDEGDRVLIDLEQVFEGYVALGEGNYGTALQIFRPAAEQGNTAAQHKLGEMYEQGHGVPQDYAKALKWYRRADDQGDETANSQLALMYFQGKGVPQDYTEAIRRFHLSIERGSSSGMHRLAFMYRHGFGVPQDYVQAHMWFNLSAATIGALIGAGSAVDSSAAPRDEIAKLMTPADILTAQQMAREWLEAHPLVKPRPPEKVKPNPSPLTQAKPQITETERLKQMIRQQIEPCWSPPVGAAEAEDLVVTIFIRVDQRGFVLEARVVDAPAMSFSTYVQAAANAARRAVLNPRCQPFELPQSRYDLWKEIRFTFDPRDMLN